MFKESFLHFVWQYQYFNSSKLETEEGESLEVIKLGNHNLNEGPDFKEARIRLGNLEWSGSVEIHRKASDWYQHSHHKDSNYHNVILHVVWESDQPVLDKSHNKIPTLVLKGLIKPGVIERYQGMISSKAGIPCADTFKNVKPITKLGTLERALVQRLEHKSEAVLKLLERNNRDWEETTYQWLCRGFGFKTNAEALMELAGKIPLKIIKKHTGRLDQIEALLFGQAGLLPEAPVDDYIDGLRREYEFLKSKYNLKEPLTRSVWKFGGVRPRNYPPIRISQLAALLNEYPNLFSFFSEIKTSNQSYSSFQVHQSHYWTSHNDVGKKVTVLVGKLSKAAGENLLMNVSVPLLVALWRDRDDDRYLQYAQDLMMKLKAEQNSIIEKWKAVGWNVSNAFDSQGLIHLYNNYCREKNCIHCGIGVELIGNRD